MKILLIEGSGGDISAYEDVLRRVGIVTGRTEERPEVEVVKF